MERFLDTASGPQCHLPMPNCIENWNRKVFSWSELMRSLEMLLRSRSQKIPKRGLWSVLTIRSLQPGTNILALSKTQATASDSQSVGEYPASVGVVKQDPAYTSLQPSRETNRSILGSHSQYCWSLFLDWFCDWYQMCIYPLPPDSLSWLLNR